MKEASFLRVLEAPLVGCLPSYWKVALELRMYGLLGRLVPGKRRGWAVGASSLHASTHLRAAFVVVCRGRVYGQHYSYCMGDLRLCSRLLVCPEGAFHGSTGHIPAHCCVCVIAEAAKRPRQPGSAVYHDISSLGLALCEAEARVLSMVFSTILCVWSRRHLSCHSPPQSIAGPSGPCCAGLAASAH
jgi:hypothetical protein